MPTLTIGLLSDTHIPHRLKRLPDAALDALFGTDLILHAGDVDAPAALEPLRAIAPVHAVRGNFHVQDLSDGGAALPAVVRLQVAGHQVVLVHGHRPGLLGFCLKCLHMLGHWLGLADNRQFNHCTARRLARLYPEAHVIVFGHSHRAHVEQVGSALVVNPGAVCPSRGERQTVARLQLGGGHLEVTIVPLLNEPQRR